MEAETAEDEQDEDLSDPDPGKTLGTIKDVAFPDSPNQDDDMVTEYTDDSVKKKLEEIKATASSLPKPPQPVQRELDPTTDTKERVKAWQDFINEFQYDFTGRKRMEPRRQGGMRQIVQGAEEIIKTSLPIQCVEAVVLAAYLTAGTTELTRIPLSFKSLIDGMEYRHIVLVLQLEGEWGAMGISRRPNLMDKAIVFPSLADLVLDYKISYETCWHDLVMVHVGLPLSHDVDSTACVKWRTLHLDLTERPWKESAILLDSYASSTKAITEYQRRTSRSVHGLIDLLAQKGTLRIRDLIVSCNNARSKSISGGGGFGYGRSTSASSPRPSTAITGTPSIASVGQASHSFPPTLPVGHGSVAVRALLAAEGKTKSNMNRHQNGIKDIYGGEKEDTDTGSSTPLPPRQPTTRRRTASTSNSTPPSPRQPSTTRKRTASCSASSSPTKPAAIITTTVKTPVKGRRRRSSSNNSISISGSRRIPDGGELEVEEKDDII